MEWKISKEPVPYEEAVAFMEAHAKGIREADAPELVWLLEHPALFTAGTSADAADLVDTLGLPVYATGRGGQYTYHGPGQRIAYVMLDLKKRGEDLRLYVQNLENWLIGSLKALDVEGFTRAGRVGVWVNMPKQSLFLKGEGNDSYAVAGEGVVGEYKIAAIGVRVRRWVSYHGVSLNVNPDLSHYRGIIPCGIREYGVTSLAALGVDAPMDEVDAQLMRTFGTYFD
jgi:lipoyl(octanoyl) transferase